MNKYIANFFKTLFIVSVLFCYTSVYADNKKASSKISKVSFKWESIDWATKYEVQIKDSNDKIVLKKIVEESSISFSLPTGKYKIRIGVYNKFDKISAWSKWSETEIIKPRDVVTSALNLGIKISAGMQYVQFLSSWDSPFGNSFKGFTGRIGFNFGDFILFRPSDTIKYTGIFRHFGMELDGTYIQFPGRDISGKIKIDMNEISFGGSFFYNTGFDFPLNLIFRLGVGVVLSEFNYYTSGGSDPDTKATSNDLYYKAGISIEYNFHKYFYLEAGTDYHVIKYLDIDLKSLRHYVQVGIKL